MIYTSYFAKMSKLPKDIIPIAICGKAPEWYHGLEYKKLAPKWSFFSEWKKTHDNNYYVEHFQKEILDLLDVEATINEIYQLANISKDRDIVLLCYEKPSDFCHRHLVSEWLKQNGHQSEEYHFE